MQYKVKLSTAAMKALKRIDRHQSQLIIQWLRSNLENCTNPRLYGKALKGNRKGQWRYRVGDYRIIANIEDQIVTIQVVNIGHRKHIYL